MTFAEQLAKHGLRQIGDRVVDTRRGATYSIAFIQQWLQHCRPDDVNVEIGGNVVRFPGRREMSQPSDSE